LSEEVETKKSDSNASYLGEDNLNYESGHDHSEETRFLQSEPTDEPLTNLPPLTSIFEEDNSKLSTKELSENHSDDIVPPPINENRRQKAIASNTDPTDISSLSNSAYENTISNGASTPRRLFSSDLSATLLLIVCILCLGMANYIYFEKSRKLNSIPDLSLFLSKFPEPVQKKEPAKPKITHQWQGDHPGSAGRIISKMVTQDFKPTDANILIVDLPRPPDSKPEEIVHGIPREPWIKRIEIENMEFHTENANSFTAKGYAKIYLDYKGGGQRIIANMTLLGSIDPDSLEIKADLKLERGLNGRSPKDPFKLEVLKSGDFRFTYASTIWLTPRLEID
ncbi:MAG: hypothetical protein KDD53_12650, partial [Bdellovibrionales bacterium]|nr:hypothetical protein [Bdellovibrionales bacterium]